MRRLGGQLTLRAHEVGHHVKNLLGSSAQRQRWLDAGLKNGSIKVCDTFSARNL